MKKKYGIFFGALAISALALVGCNEGGNTSGSGDGAVATLNVVDSVVTLDCFADYAMELETENVDRVVWTTSDPTVLTVDENGVVRSTDKEGTATVTATAGTLSDSCEVTVMIKSGTPVFTAESSIVISEGYRYETTAAVYYNGMDVTEYASFGVYMVEGDGVATATVEGATYTYVGGESGTASFTAYATMFGKTYAETVRIEVKESNLSFVVRGESDGGLLLRPNKTVTLDDVLVYDAGNLVASEQLNWTIADEAIATVGEGGKLVYGKEGSTVMTAEYAGQTLSVVINVIKDRSTVTLEQSEPLAIDLGIDVTAKLTTYPSAGVRTYVVNETKEATVDFCDETVSGEVVYASVGDMPLDTSALRVEGGILTMPVRVFGTDIYGEQTFQVIIEGTDTVHEYTFNALLVTKYIRDAQTFKTCMSNGWQGDKIFGYYILAQDIDVTGIKEFGTYATNWDYTSGFRGTMDGAGHKVLGFTPNSFGLSAQIGIGAVVKNLVIDGVRYFGEADAGKSQNAILARGIGGATIENVTINLAEESTPENGGFSSNVGGLFSHVCKDSTFRNITVNACNDRIFSLVGKQETACAYENVVIHNGLVQYYYNSVEEAPEGIKTTGIVQYVTDLPQSGTVYDLELKKNGAFDTVESVFVYVNGERVPTADLGWAVANGAIAAIDENGVITPLEDGETTVSTTMAGVEITLRVSVAVLPRVEKQVETQSEVNLDMKIVYYPTLQKREYLPSETAKGTLTLLSDANYGTLFRVVMDGKTLDVTGASYANGVLTIPTSVFGNVYGEKTVTVETRTANTVYSFSVPVLFITKTLVTVEDVESALIIRHKGEVLYGHYVLGGDVDCNGEVLNCENLLDWNENNGFRGTFDGKGFAFLNYVTSIGGVFVQTGKGAVIKNVDFQVTKHVNPHFCVLSRESAYTTVENVTVTILDGAAVSFTTGLMTGASKHCQYKKVTVDAVGLTLDHIFGSLNSATTTYEQVTVIASSVTSYYDAVEAAPSGVTFQQASNE